MPLLWVEPCSPKRYVEVLTPVNVNLLGKRVFADVIELR